MPVQEEAFKKLPDVDKAHSSLGYPSIFLHSGSRKPVTLAPRRSKQDPPMGLPCIPILVVNKDDAEVLNADDVVESVRKLWHQSCIPATFKLNEWLERTGKAPVTMAEVEATPKWPLLKPTAGEKPKEQEKNDQGMFTQYYFKKFKSLNLAFN